MLWPIHFPDIGMFTYINNIESQKTKCFFICNRPQLDDEQSEHLCKLLKIVHTENPEWFAGKTSTDE